jgi:hypothetical protein
VVPAHGGGGHGGDGGDDGSAAGSHGASGEGAFLRDNTALLGFLTLFSGAAML